MPTDIICMKLLRLFPCLLWTFDLISKRWPQVFNLQQKFLEVASKLFRNDLEMLTLFSLCTGVIVFSVIQTACSSPRLQLEQWFWIRTNVYRQCYLLDNKMSVIRNYSANGIQYLKFLDDLIEGHLLYCPYATWMPLPTSSQLHRKGSHRQTSVPYPHGFIWVSYFSFGDI